jgi:hypothetical protein
MAVHFVLLIIDSAVLSFPSGQKESTKESALLIRSDIFARILRNGLRCATRAVRAIQGRLFWGDQRPHSRVAQATPYSKRLADSGHSKNSMAKISEAPSKSKGGCFLVAVNSR